MSAIKISPLKRISLRSDTEEHRQASWLELFTDLGFVVAISSLTAIFKQGFTGQAIVVYSLSFFAVFWLWNRLTWYSTYYDNDDTFFRLSFLVSVFFVIGFATSVSFILAGNYLNSTLWYLGVEFILLVLWARTLFSSQNFRQNTLSFFTTYLIGFCLIVLSIFLNNTWKYVAWALAFMLEIVGPIIGWYLSKGKIMVHTRHVLERHGLFVIILLGEGLVAISGNLIQHFSLPIFMAALLSFATVAALWWIYFNSGFEHTIKLSQNIRNTFIYGYGHFFIYIAIAFALIAIEMILHQIEHSTVNGPQVLLLLSLGAFLILMAIIQRYIACPMPKGVVWIRTIAGSLLVIFSLLPIDANRFAVLLVALLVLIAVAANESNRWGAYKRKKMMNQRI